MRLKSAVDQRIKSKFSAKLMRWPSVARGFCKYFEVLSLIFVILLLVSLAFSAYGIYNYAVYGNCNGEDSDGVCIFGEIEDGVGKCADNEDNSITGSETVIKGVG